jgi:hypothetical protein
VEDTTVAKKNVEKNITAKKTVAVNTTVKKAVIESNDKVVEIIKKIVKDKTVTLINEKEVNVAKE